MGVVGNLLAGLGGIGSAIGGIGQGVGSIIGAIGGISSSKKANEINEDNYQLQVDNLEYQKALQQEIFEREDTAYQRTINDLRSSGLSPLAMNGTNNAGTVIQTTAPQNQFNDTLSSVVGIASALGSLAQVQSGIARTDAETQYIKEQAENLGIKNLYEADKLGMENTRLRFGVANDLKDIESSNYYGYSNNMPDAIKQLLILSSGDSFHTEFKSSDGSSHRFPSGDTVSSESYGLGNSTLNTSEVFRFISPVLDILKAFR